MKCLLLITGALLLAMWSKPSISWSQGMGGPAGTSGNTPSGYAPVMVERRKLFDIMGSQGLSAPDRADRVNRRLSSLVARNDPIRPFNKQDLQSSPDGTTITLGGEPILTVTDVDAQDALATRDELALLWGGKMATAVADARAVQATPLQGAGILIRNSFADLLRSVLQWLPRLAGALTLFLLFWLFARFNRWAVKAVVSHIQLDMNLRQLLRAVVFYGTWLVGFMAILSTLGLQSGGIATTLGVSGFVLGFAFKDILAHFFAGLMLLMGRQFHIGDQIVVKEFEGTVERIELRALYLRTYDNRLVIIPNGDVFTSVVTSNTASPLRRRDFVLGIDYSADVEKAKAVALEALRKVSGVAEDPAPDVLVDELAASAVNLRVRFYTNSKRADYLTVGSECMRRVKEAFGVEKISLPTDTLRVMLQKPEELAGQTQEVK